MSIRSFNTTVKVSLRRHKRFCRRPASGLRYAAAGVYYPAFPRVLLASCILLLTSFFFVCCNEPFQPEVQYTPRLNIYSILFANAHGAYVRVMSVTESPSDVSKPIRGATVGLNEWGNGIDTTYALADTSEIVNGDTVAFYFTGRQIMPGRSYRVSVNAKGYPPTYSTVVTVPFGYATLPSQSVYSFLRDPAQAFAALKLDVNLSWMASAAFVQIFVEYRGLDSSGKLHTGSFSVLPVDSVNPYTEIEAAKLEVAVDLDRYRGAFYLAQDRAKSLMVSHMYVDIVVTQIDDNLYRYFVTSMRSSDPLSMRTDKIIFTNFYSGSGTGIVSGASVDTTRIYLF